MTLIDLSRNIHTFDENEEMHRGLLGALGRQRRKAIQKEGGAHMREQDEAEGGEEDEDDLEEEGVAGKSVAADKEPQRLPADLLEPRGRQESAAKKAKMDKCITFGYLETLIFTTAEAEIEILYMDLVDNVTDLYATSLKVIINGRDFREHCKRLKEI